MTNLPNPNFDTKPTGAMRPEHHVHDSSEPLPKPVGDYDTGDTGAMGRDTGEYRTPGQAQDRLGQYGASSPETSNVPGRDRPGQVGFEDQRGPTTGTGGAASRGGEGRHSERPLGVQPARQGGVAIGGRENEDMPMGKAGLGDKMIGKTQKVMGKMSNNPEMHEKGELREAGGKPAVSGSARAPHD